MAVKDGMLMHHDAKDQLLEMAVKDGMLMHHDAEDQLLRDGCQRWHAYAP